MSNDDTNATTARILMKTTGATFNVTGLALSTCSILYATRYITTSGCCLLEYLPHLFTPESTKSFIGHMQSSNPVSFWALGVTVGLITLGAAFRKLGTTVTDPVVIERVENFLYKTDKKQNTRSE